MKNIKRIALVMLIAAFAGGMYTWFFVYNKPHPDYENLKAEYNYKPQALFDEYRTQNAVANEKCTGKMISIKGKIDFVESSENGTIVVFVLDRGIFGDEGIRCTLLDKYSTVTDNLDENAMVEIKGFCSGYNETDVIMEKCTINLV